VHFDRGLGTLGIGKGKQNALGNVKKLQHDVQIQTLLPIEPYKVWMDQINTFGIKGWTLTHLCGILDVIAGTGVTLQVHI
jgi:hypothetical protein